MEYKSKAFTTQGDEIIVSPFSVYLRNWLLWDYVAKRESHLLLCLLTDHLLIFIFFLDKSKQVKISVNKYQASLFFRQRKLFAVTDILQTSFALKPLDLIVLLICEGEAAATMDGFMDFHARWRRVFGDSLSLDDDAMWARDKHKKENKGREKLIQFSISARRKKTKKNRHCRWDLWFNNINIYIN